MIQKRAICIDTMSHHHQDYTTPLFAKLHTLTLTDINQLQTGIFNLMFKYNNLLPQPYIFFIIILKTRLSSTLI